MGIQMKRLGYNQPLSLHHARQNVPCERRPSAKPSLRKISMDRPFVKSIFGHLIGLALSYESLKQEFAYFVVVLLRSSRTDFTPKCASTVASSNPTGPPPAINTVPSARFSSLSVAGGGAWTSGARTACAVSNVLAIFRDKIFDEFPLKN